MISNPLDRIRSLKKSADNDDDSRKAFASFVSRMRNQGWTDADVSKYTAQVRILMGKDDAATLDLFPAGLYQTAQAARDAAVKFWRNTK